MVIIKTGDKTTGFKGKPTAIVDHNLCALDVKEIETLIEGMIEYLSYKLKTGKKEQEVETQVPEKHEKTQKRRDIIIDEDVQVQKTLSEKEKKYLDIADENGEQLAAMKMMLNENLDFNIALRTLQKLLKQRENEQRKHIKLQNHEYME